MSIDKSYLEEHFYPRFYDLSEETILEMNRMAPDGPVNNVIRGIRKECFGLFLGESEVEEDYFLFYVNGEGRELKGDMLKLNLHEKDRDKLTGIFARYLVDNYRLELVSVFNTYQNSVQTFAEQLEYYTITNTDLEPFGDQNATMLIPGAKGAVLLRYMKHEDLYSSILGNAVPSQKADGVNYVYLMLNKRNLLVKIGRSNHPSHRERTLQAEEPEVLLLAYWKAGPEAEKALHSRFSSKRQRGEWFELDFRGIRAIREFMDMHYHQ